MPRQYVTPSDVNSSAIGIALAAQISQLPAGEIDRVTFRASRRVDGFCRRRLGAPQSTTVGTGGITAGATVLPVSSTLGWDNKEEECVIVGSGNLLEIIPLVPGGVIVTSFASPYAGTLQLAQAVAFNHLAGDPVVGCYQEVAEASSSSSSETFGQEFLTQEAQLAQAHAPPIGRSSRITRLIFLRQYPLLLPIIKVEHKYPFANSFGTLTNISAMTPRPAQGILELAFATVVFPQGLTRVTYQAGSLNVPDDVKEAAINYFADELLAFFNPAGADQVQMGKRNVKYGAKSRYVMRAEEILSNGYKRGGV